MSSFSRSSRKAARRIARRRSNGNPLNGYQRRYAGMYALPRFARHRAFLTEAMKAAVEGDDDAWEAYGEEAFTALTGDRSAFHARLGWPAGYGRMSRGEPTAY